MPHTNRKRKRGSQGGSKFRTLRLEQEALTAAANPEALLPTTPSGGALTAAPDLAALLLPTTRALTAAANPVAKPLAVPFPRDTPPDSRSSPLSQLPVGLVLGFDLVGDGPIFSPFSSFSFESDAKEDQDIKELKHVSDGN